MSPMLPAIGRQRKHLRGRGQGRGRGRGRGSYPSTVVDGVALNGVEFTMEMRKSSRGRGRGKRVQCHDNDVTEGEESASARKRRSPSATPVGVVGKDGHDSVVATPSTCAVVTPTTCAVATPTTCAVTVPTTCAVATPTTCAVTVPTASVLTTKPNPPISTVNLIGILKNPRVLSNTKKVVYSDIHVRWTVVM